jgi:hypothetical protein
MARLYWNPTKAMNIPHLHERDAEQLFEAAPAISNCATWTLGSSVKGAGERPRKSRADHFNVPAGDEETKLVPKSEVSAKTLFPHAAFL